MNISFTPSQTEPVGDWFQTFSGKKFYPMDPRPDQICITDIAHALANICRFNGHTKQFYSVAQHSIMVSCIVPKELAFAGLMHDATEAYVGDMVRPLKVNLPDYKIIEQTVWNAIVQKWQRLPLVLPPEIKSADNVALMTERRDLLKQTGHNWSTPERPLPDKIIVVCPHRAEAEFLARFAELSSGWTTDGGNSYKEPKS